MINAMLPVWAHEMISEVDAVASAILLAADGVEPVPLDRAWGKPIADFIRALEFQAEDATTDDRFLAAMRDAAGRIPGLLREMDMAPLQTSIEAGLAESIVDGVMRSLDKLGPRLLALAADIPPVELGPLAKAIERLGARDVVAAKLTSAEWAKVPLAIRDRAFWSARVESARLVQSMRETLDKRLAWASETIAKSRTAAGGEALIDRSTFIGEMRALAIAEGIDTTDPRYYGTVRDIRSAKRLGLVWDMQTTQATEFARWKMDHDPDVLDQWPAQRLVRLEDRLVKRDWAALWRSAGQETGWEGASRSALVALKTAPIWSALSVFGTPWPPFDWGSGMGLEDVERTEAEALGLLTRDAPVPKFDEGSDPVGFNDQLQASITDLSAPMLSWLQSELGDRVSVADGALIWRSGQ